ncbi:vacuolar protein sorting-associated protein 13B isoform X3 [Drosophila santomea]|uniref:vacuolar protein sorting-associated protein 13B isoform X3 n=1 Tax=Drosophila santomea TaxID=129105 RepID=UPI001953C558|nr:vacuolar protein sorting-associated protein 13B isoform X3 [Drosophila santomea]
MFKLESYITPILLSYVAKYVKNFRDEDAQVSLWEGEVTFQNLDLRLEVLEEELNLPVELVSGHIHELSILVPWTKLMSEPVKIVINTIEFVAKLPDSQSKQRRASFQREQRRKSKRDSVEQPDQTKSPGPASSSSVVNKIINNISLQCHNIILKYVEDDIVVSMNVQTLNFSSAGEDWKATMVDIHPVSVVMRKLLQISDLTICLDKRNTAGRIEVCQEPVLYRCTLECRVLRKYNANTVTTTSTTRIGVFTKSLDINVSSLQFPMVMRLVKMLLELKPAEFEEDPQNPEDQEAVAEGSESQQGTESAGQSVFWWAWSLLPSFDTEAPSSSCDSPTGHAFDLGIYAEELNFQLKNSEYFTDQSMGGIKRIRYTPILRISLGGLYYERTILKECDWANVKAGLSSMCMEPLGAYRSDDPVDRKLVNTQEFQQERSFIDKSLFDENYMFADRSWCSYNYEDYVARNTDEYMLFRSPVLAFDVIEHRVSKPSSHPVAESQLRDLGVRIQYRLLSAGITFHFSQSFVQVKKVISDLIRPYDYPGYRSESVKDEDRGVPEPENKHSEMTIPDLEYLMGLVPTCNYKIELRNIVVQLYPRQQHEESSAMNQHQLTTTVRQSLLPYLQLKVSLVEGTMCGPVNPVRLVQLITHLQDKPREVVNACYNCFHFNVKNLALMILNTTPDNGQAKLLNIPRVQVNWNRLLAPHLWRQNEAPLETSEIKSEIITLEFSKRELIVAKRLVPLISSFSGPDLCDLAHIVANVNANSDVIKLQSVGTKLSLSYHRYHTHLAAVGSLQGVHTDAVHTKMNIRNVVLSTSKNANNKWLEMQCQFPLEEVNSEQEKIPGTVVCLWLEPFRITTDIYLLQFLDFSDNSGRQKTTDKETDLESVKQSEQPITQSVSNYSTISASAMVLNDFQPRRISRNNSRKISVPEETVHLSSERDERHTQAEPLNIPVTSKPQPSNFDTNDFVKRLTKMVVLVEIAQAKIDVCEVMMRKTPGDTDVEYTSIRLPHIKVKSGNCEAIQRGNIRGVIPVANNTELFNWVFDLNEFNVCYRNANVTEMIVAPVRTTITLALSFKTSEKADEGKAEGKSDRMAKDSPEQNTYSINVHVDMSAINIFAQRVKLLHEHCLIISKMYGSLCPGEPASKWQTAKMKPRLEVYTGSAQNYPAIKEFLELDPNFEAPQVKSAPKSSVVLFCQWTIPRISFEMENSNDFKHSKIVMILEDLLLNIDKHSDFNKITTKIENFGLNYYEEKHKEWEKIDDLHIKMLGDSTNLPLISVVITTVSLEDLYAKIGARNPHNMQHTISEVLIEVQPIEMVLNLDQITEFMVPICEVLEIMGGSVSAQPVNTPSAPVQSKITTVQDLPMVHLNSKGIYVYLPLSTGKKGCSVLLLRIENIQLTPSLENPLVRQLVRPDIYQKAAELNMLSTPGALVEDRQYELSVRRVSLSTGNWKQTQEYRIEKTLASKHDNPAFEWNNQSQSTELDHMEIFKDFDFIMIYAPAISYDRFLVCGQSVEYNCATDFVASLNTHQISLISCIIVRAQRLSCIIDQVCVKNAGLPKARSHKTLGEISKYNSVDNSIYFPPDPKACKDTRNLKSSKKRVSDKISSTNASTSFTDAKGSSDYFYGSCQSDSGIHLGSRMKGYPRSLVAEEINRSGRQPFVLSYPSSVSFVAGIFVLKIYDVLQLEELERPVMKPLFLMTVSQPSFMSTKNFKAAVTQASIFNVSISVARANAEGKMDSERFNESVFDTLPGQLGSSGIPPPLLTIKTQYDRLHQKDVDVELRKPILLRICENTIKQLASDVIRIYTVLHETPCFNVRSQRPVPEGSQLRQMKTNCYNADRFHFSSDRITAKFYDEERTYKCSFVWLDVSTRIKFSSRPQKSVIRSNIGSFYVQSGEKMLLHPLLMRLSVDLVSEPWSEELLVNATLKLNHLHIDAGVFSILQLQKAQHGMNRIREYADREWQQFLRSRPVLGTPKDVSPCDLIKCTPSHESIDRLRRPLKSNAEFYQDDLRAGAFQFVYLNSESVLPMPYQVQIIKKNYGIICWRYPQPRQMTSIHIYPVPMPVSRPIHIRCRMEYFSETHETFLHYCDFMLSETSTKQLTPPDRPICATIWRVVILQSLISVDGTCFEGSEDEDLSIEYLQSDFKVDENNDFILHPKVLVGCMRIDTVFRADKVPKLQLLLCCQDIELNFMNQTDNTGELPKQLNKYHLRQTANVRQTFLTVHVEELQMHSSIYSRKDFSLQTEMRTRVECLDYGFLNMLDVLESMKFSSYVRLTDYPRSLVQANFLVDKLRLNCGPHVIHTLLSSKYHWQEVLQQKAVRHVVMPKLVIVNRIQAPISFGQTNTVERIPVNPGEMQLYHFRSCSHAQELTFFITNAKTHLVESSDSVHIALKFEDEEKIHHLRVGENCITLKLGKLSSTQIYILVKGQIELISMVPFHLVTEFREEEVNYDESTPPEHLLMSKERSSYYQNVKRNADINMRLKLTAGLGRGRTGDIPLKTNNNLPWLVKVPTQSAQQFISIWVRILREDIKMDKATEDFQPQKILICIWPIFEICNMLSCAVKATESTTGECSTIEAKGGRWALNTATTHATEHSVGFTFSGVFRGSSKDEYSLMLRTMDWHKFFYYDPSVWTIENALHKLGKSSKIKWPLNDPEELRVSRVLDFENPFDVKYQTKATREFSCCQGLDVTAWGMFINGTALDVSILMTQEQTRLDLKANSLQMMPKLRSAFTIDVRFDNGWMSSTPICLEDFTQKSSSNGGRSLYLRYNSFVDIVIVERDEVLRLVLEYRQEEDGRRLFKLRSKFVFTNFTDVLLNALTLAMDHKENSTREEVEAYSVSKKARSLISSDSTKNCMGNAMDVFYDLNAHKAKHNCDTAFVYFVCFSVGGNREISIPIPLAIPFTRRCFSLQAGHESIPLMITLIEKDNIHYLNVFRDTAPAIAISNNTNVKFIVAQTSASEHSNVSCTNSEFVGRNFEWNQLVLPHSNCYYTPPQMYANFPDVEFTMCNLSLAVYKDKSCAKNKIAWSKPIRTDKSWQKFLHVPHHGDVKVVVCDKHRAIRLNIYYIAQQLEFSVKDLRSRLTKPENDSIPSQEQAALRPEVSLEQESGTIRDTSPNMVTCAHFNEECESKTQTRIKIFIKSFVFSLQTDNRQNDYLKTEVCNIYADDSMLIYDDDDDQRELRLQLPNLQIDNQLYSSGKYDFPVLLCAEKLYRRNCSLPQVYDLDFVYKQQAQRTHVSLFTFIFYQDEMQLQNVRCQIPPFRVYIEDAYLNQLLEALVECEPSNCVYSPPVEQEQILLPVGMTLLPDQVVAQSLYISEPLRLNSFTVEPLSLLLSVHTSSRLYIALDHSPLSFSRYERQQILTVPLRFGQSLGLHYLSGAIFGAGWVVGSLEILGSPSGLARSFSTGLRDFVSMPVQGLFRGPWGFLVGVTQGSASLLRNVTAGTVNSVTKLAGSVARNLDRLTLDAEHIELTEARRRARPQGFADGLTQGLTGLGISLLGAVGGLAHHTLEARSSVGVIAGLTKGIVGALTKPISGAAEMLALTGQGVLHTVGFNAMPQQVEPSFTRNTALHGSSNRIWSYLPEELSRDQMLFFCEITLLISTQLRPALLFLTSSVLAIMQSDSEDLAFASPVSKVDVLADRDDPSKLYLSLKSERRDDFEGQLNYTNERIMKFLNASRLQSIANDSLNDLLQLHELDVDDRIQRQSQCIFYIKPNIGEHLIHYLKVISRIQH